MVKVLSIMYGMSLGAILMALVVAFIDSLKLYRECKNPLFLLAMAAIVVFGVFMVVMSLLKCTH